MHVLPQSWLYGCLGRFALGPRRDLGRAGSSPPYRQKLEPATMPRRIPAASRPEPRRMTVEEMQKAIGRIQRRIEELNKVDPATASEHDVATVQRAIEESLDLIFGRRTHDYDRFISAARLDKGPVRIGVIAARGCPFRRSPRGLRTRTRPRRTSAGTSAPITWPSRSSAPTDFWVVSAGLFFSVRS